MVFYCGAGTKMKKQVPDFPNYFATKGGRIWSTKRGGRWLKPNWTGRLVVGLYKNRRPHRRLVHRLVLETFIGPCPVGMEACHNNGNRQDNRLANLRWDTHSNNVKDAVKHGTHIDNRGEKNGQAKLRASDIRTIRGLLKLKTPQVEIAEIFHISRATVTEIKYKKRWKHILT